MNRALLKQDAKDAMKAANPHPVLTTLVFWAIQLAAQIILGIVSSICGFTTYFAAAISSGMYEDSAFLNYVPSSMGKYASSSEIPASSCLKTFRLYA